MGCQAFLPTHLQTGNRELEVLNIREISKGNSGNFRKSFSGLAWPGPWVRKRELRREESVFCAESIRADRTLNCSSIGLREGRGTGHSLAPLRGQGVLFWCQIGPKKPSGTCGSGSLSADLYWILAACYQGRGCRCRTSPELEEALQWEVRGGVSRWG